MDRTVDNLRRDVALGIVPEASKTSVRCQFGEGDLNAVLISNSTGAVSSGARASNAHSTLKLTKRA
ncbi:MAG TPA: hypothetical protein VGM79_13085 [Streptosporangiaceae bacterium]